MRSIQTVFADLQKVADELGTNAATYGTEDLSKGRPLREVAINLPELLGRLADAVRFATSTAFVVAEDAFDSQEGATMDILTGSYDVLVVDLRMHAAAMRTLPHVTTENH